MKIPLNQLKPDPNNIRKVKANNLDALIASIQSRDLLHNLVVKKNGTGYIIIDGNRRFKALQEIYGAESIEPVECKVIDEHDREVGLHANMMREGMHPLDESDVIFKLCEDGSEDFDSIAKRFGQTGKWVQQRVALSELIPAVKKAFRNCEMNLGTASLFTRLNKTQQSELFKSCEGDYDYRDIKWQIDNAQIMKDKVIIPPNHKLYKDIEFEGDLFSDRQYVANVDQLQKLQMEYVEDKIAYWSKRFEKVHYLEDTPVYEATNIVKHLTKDFDKKTYKDADLQITVHYDWRRGEFYMQKWLDKRKASAAEIEAVENGEVPELTLADMSNPQHQEMIQMHFGALRNAIYNQHKPDPQYMLGYFCGLLFTPYSNISAEPVTPSFENGLNKPSNLFENELHEIKVALASWVEQNPGLPRASFFIGKGYQYCCRALYVRSIVSSTEGETNEMNELMYKSKLDKNWFQPDYNWIKKYKTTQLYMLCNELKIKYSERDKKGDLVEKIVASIRDGKSFDPIELLKNVK